MEAAVMSEADDQNNRFLRDFLDVVDSDFVKPVPEFEGGNDGQLNATPTLDEAVPIHDRERKNLRRTNAQTRHKRIERAYGHGSLKHKISTPIIKPTPSPKGVHFNYTG